MVQHSHDKRDAGLACLLDVRFEIPGTGRQQTRAAEGRMRRWPPHDAPGRVAHWVCLLLQPPGGQSESRRCACRPRHEVADRVDRGRVRVRCVNDGLDLAAIDKLGQSKVHPTSQIDARHSDAQASAKECPMHAKPTRDNPRQPIAPRSEEFRSCRRGAESWAGVLRQRVEVSPSGDDP